MAIRNKTNIMVKRVKFGPLLERAYETFKTKYPERTEVIGIRTEAATEFGYVTTKDGDLYVLDNEGTGDSSPITDSNPYLLSLYAKREETPGKSFSVTELNPVFTASLRPEDFKEYETEEVDLSCFIRTFGSRLESNFHEWKDFLKPLV